MKILITIFLILVGTTSAQIIDIGIPLEDQPINSWAKPEPSSPNSTITINRVDNESILVQNNNISDDWWETSSLTGTFWYKESDYETIYIDGIRDFGGFHEISRSRPTDLKYLNGVNPDYPVTSALWKYNYSEVSSLNDSQIVDLVWYAGYLRQQELAEIQKQEELKKLTEIQAAKDLANRTHVNTYEVS